ncbi:hypothetical protein V1264_024770 [Littorina saxatilis]|uniref:Uncharacterized protein n=1 Tax=Littorina saxatilis TaxID=31220 RepID=A0AAN9ALU4_9CAEN
MMHCVVLFTSTHVASAPKPNQDHSENPEIPKKNEGLKDSTIAAIGAVSTSVVFNVIIVLIVFCLIRKRRRRSMSLRPLPSRLSVRRREMSYWSLRSFPPKPSNPSFASSHSYLDLLDDSQPSTPKTLQNRQGAARSPDTPAAPSSSWQTNDPDVDEDGYLRPAAS